MAKEVDKDDIPEGFNVPEGFKLVRETRTERIQILVTPNLHNKMRKYIDAYNANKSPKDKTLSLNEFINTCIKEYLKKHSK